MEGICEKCGEKFESLWKFCPHCGAAKTVATQAQVLPPATDRAPVRGAFSGLLIGALAAPVLIIVGMMLCLTGLGAFLGVPMIIAGIVAPLMGPVIGFGALKGKCPWCGSPVSSINSKQSFACTACNKMIAVKIGRFVRVT